MTKMMFSTSLEVKFLINKFAFDLRRRKQVFNECIARAGTEPEDSLIALVCFTEAIFNEFRDVCFNGDNVALIDNFEINIRIHVL